MTTNQSNFKEPKIEAPQTVQSNSTTRKSAKKRVAGLSYDDCSKIRKNRMYKGQLDYIKEVLLAENTNLDDSSLSERLDVSKSVAKLLLHDCLTECSHNEEEQR